MATPSSPKPVYHDPSSTGQTRGRRSSSRKSFTSSLTIPSIDSPRTVCPRDGDAFSYDPAHLPAWHIPQELWEQLPAQLQNSVAELQLAGAAVLTGFKRLDRQTEDMVSDRLTKKLEDDELSVQLDDHALPPPKLRTTSNASSFFQSDLSSPVFDEPSNSETGSPATPFSTSQDACPVSPICLTPADADFPSRRVRSSERSFSIPLEPHDAYYATELSNISTEAIPRLRHKALRVDTEWYEAKRTGAISAATIVDFESWWAQKNGAIQCLNEKGKRMSSAMGLSPTGMGWSAP